MIGERNQSQRTNDNYIFCLSWNRSVNKMHVLTSVIIFLLHHRIMFAQNYFQLFSPFHVREIKKKLSDFPTMHNKEMKKPQHTERKHDERLTKTYNRSIKSTARTKEVISSSNKKLVNILSTFILNMFSSSVLFQILKNPKLSIIC